MRIKNLINMIKRDLQTKLNLYLLLLFIAFNIFLAIYSIKINNIYAIKGQAGFIFLAVLLFALKSKLNMGRLTFFILLLGFSSHLSHILGNFYYTSPVFIPWDYVTHIVSFIGVSLLFFNFQKRRIDSKKICCFRNVFLFILLFLAIGGVGVLVELGEYAGYAVLGLKDGALLFGGGDFDKIVATSDVLTEIDIRGGGWYDSMGDLLINTYTSFLTLAILFAIYFYKHKKK